MSDGTETDATVSPEAGEPTEEQTERAYFEAIETAFARLRGTPLLLSSTDWQVARRWYRDGLPIALVETAMADLFARRKERGARGRVSSLRYCVPAVEAAWAVHRDLVAPADREAAAPLDVPARLAALAAALPEGLPERAAWAARIVGLEGASHLVEESLAALDRDLMAAAGEGLDAANRAEVAAAIDRRVAALAGRLPDGELSRARERLAVQALRHHLGLPVLSLFSPEAEGPSEAAVG